MHYLDPFSPLSSLRACLLLCGSYAADHITYRPLSQSLALRLIRILFVGGVLVIFLALRLLLTLRILLFLGLVGGAFLLLVDEAIVDEIVQRDNCADYRGEVDGEIMSLVLTAKALTSSSTFRLGSRLKISCSW